MRMVSGMSNPQVLPMTSACFCRTATLYTQPEVWCSMDTLQRLLAADQGFQEQVMSSLKFNAEQASMLMPVFLQYELQAVQHWTETD